MIHWLHPGQWPVYIGFTTDEGSFQRATKRMGVPREQVPHWISPGASATMHSFDSATGQTTFIICITPQGRKQTREQHASLIAHEALHVVQEMNRIFSPHGPFDDESAAYLLQHIVQHCLTHAWKTGRTRKTRP